MSVMVLSPTLLASARVPSGEMETSWVFLPAGMVAITFLAAVSMILTVWAPTLATRASFPSRLMATLWAPLPALMVAIALPVLTPKTWTSPDVMLVTQTSWARPLVDIDPDTAKTMAAESKIRIVDFCIC